MKLLPSPTNTARRAVPGLLAVTLAQEAIRHVEEQLPKARRRRVLRILRASHGRPSHLTSRQRRELASAWGDLRPWTLARRLATTAITAHPTRR